MPKQRSVEQITRSSLSIGVIYTNDDERKFLVACLEALRLALQRAPDCQALGGEN